MKMFLNCSFNQRFLRKTCEFDKLHVTQWLFVFKISIVVQIVIYINTLKSCDWQMPIRDDQRRGCEVLVIVREKKQEWMGGATL